MSGIRKTAHFLIYSNLIISAAVACFTLQTALFFPEHAAILQEFSVLNFISTFVLYNLQRLYYASHENSEGRYNWYNANRRLIFTLIVLLMISFAGRVCYFFLSHPDFLIVYALLTLLSIFYFLPPLRLRRHGVLKPFIIAFVFISTGILLPLYQTIQSTTLLYASGQFCFIAGLCLLFDIKDIRHDTLLALPTLPVRYGVRTTKQICSLLFLAPAAITLFFFPQFLYVELCLSGLCLLVCLMAEGRKPWFYYLLVDGLILAQYFLLQAFAARFI